ncbi:MAG: hypothetical protein ABIS01_09430 [Ferruginibacter sp.]
MKKNNMTGSPKTKEPLKEAPATSPKKDGQGGKNSNFPQEYEEQRSEEIRMKPQPFVKLKKSGGKKLTKAIRK